MISRTLAGSTAGVRGFSDSFQGRPGDSVNCLDDPDPESFYGKHAP